MRFFVGLLLAVSCAGEEPIPVVPSAPPITPPPPDPLYDPATLSSPKESLAARPLRWATREPDKWGAAAYAPSQQMDPIPNVQVTKTAKLDRDLDRDFLSCSVGKYLPYADIVVVRARETPVLRHPQSSRTLFSLPLWSVARGETMTVEVHPLEKNAPALKATGTYDGTIPIVLGGDVAVTCHLVRREDMPRTLGSLSSRIDDSLKRAESGTFDLQKLTSVDAFHDALLLDDVYTAEMASLVGWADPVVHGYVERLDRLAVVWDKRHDAMFTDEYARATGTVVDESVRRHVTKVLCAPKQAFPRIEGLGEFIVRGALLLGTNAPAELGCGVEYTNEGKEPVSTDIVSHVILLTRKGVAYGRIARGSGSSRKEHEFEILPGETRTYTVYAPIDPSAIDGEAMLIVSNWKELRLLTEKALVRVR